MTTQTDLNPSTCVCVGKSTPPTCQTATSTPHRLAFMLENPHHQHVKPPPMHPLRMRLCWKIHTTSTSNHHKCTHRLAFVLSKWTDGYFFHISPRPPRTNVCVPYYVQSQKFPYFHKQNKYTCPGKVPHPSGQWSSSVSGWLRQSKYFHAHDNPRLLYLLSFSEISNFSPSEVMHQDFRLQSTVAENG